MDNILYARVSARDPGMPEYTIAPTPPLLSAVGCEDELDSASAYAGHLQTNVVHGMLNTKDLVVPKQVAGERTT